MSLSIIKGKIRTRHWIFGIGLPIQGMAMTLAHTTPADNPFSAQAMISYATLIYGILDWHKNSGKN